MKTVKQYMADCTGTLNDGDDSRDAMAAKASAMLQASVEVIASQECGLSPCGDGFHELVDAIFAGALASIVSMTSAWNARNP